MSAADLPSPLVPAWVDLRCYDWFHFYHKRLRQSEFWKSASDLACRISVDLWSEAYEQVPAASIPNNDHVLSEWAGFGRRDLTGWLAIKDEVLSAWTLCSDGRWYHPTLSEVACQAGVDRRRYLWARECDRIRKENVRRQKAGSDPLPMPPKPSDDPWQGGPFVTLAADDVGAAESDEIVPADVHGISGGHPAEGYGNPQENALKGKGKGKGIYKKDASSLCSDAPRAPAEPKRKAERQHVYPPDAFERWYAAYPVKKARQDAERAFRKIVAADAIAFDTLVDGIARFRRANPDVNFWPHPATWLNGGRWTDEPSAAGTPATLPTDPLIVDFGGGRQWPERNVLAALGRWQRDPSSWPPDIGSPPGQPGCRVPAHLLQRAGIEPPASPDTTTNGNGRFHLAVLDELPISRGDRR